MTRIKQLCNATAIGLVAMALASCTSNQWKAEGTLADGGGKQLVLEAPTAYGSWSAIDTIEVKADGTFVVKGDAVGHPEIFRLTLDGESLYFPIDSVETVNIKATSADFANGYTIAGSPLADKMQQVNDVIAKAMAENGASALAEDPAVKLQLANIILTDPSDVVAYYTLFRKVGDYQLFDHNRKADLRIIGAVANAYSVNRPDDPRTKFLTDLYVKNRRSGQVSTTMEATEVVLPDLKLRDAKGELRDIHEEAAKGKVIVLNFTAYNVDGSALFNLALSELYKKYASQGLEIFQVSVDSDEYAWKDSALNMPWIAVYNSAADGSQVLFNYNVTEIPTTYLINRNGELVERIADMEQLEEAVKKLL